MLTDTDKPIHAEGYKAAYFDGELILYDPKQSEALCLNQTAALVWSLCDGETSIADIRKTLSDVFEDATDVSADVTAALERLRANKCIQLDAG